MFAGILLVRGSHRACLSCLEVLSAGERRRVGRCAIHAKVRVDASHVDREG